MKPLISRENPPAQRARIYVGALYGFLGGLAFALASGTVDALTYPSLPIHILWEDILWRALSLGFGLALGGACAGYSEETVQGVFTSAAVLALIALVVSIVESALPIGMRLIAFITLILPIAAACFPMAWLLRWLINRQGRLSDKTSAERMRGAALLILLVLAVGAAPAAFTRLRGSALRAVTLIHERFQAAAAGDADVIAKLPLTKTPGLPARLGQPYTLSYVKSKTSTVGYDVTLWFADGYTATCTLVAYGEQKPYLNGCVEGEEIKSPR